jgi:MFS family permease
VRRRLAITASSFETLLLARVLQGLGTSATRVIATSIVRDCYAGRRMASVMSLAMMVFIAVPVIAPSLGQAVMSAEIASADGWGVVKSLERWGRGPVALVRTHYSGI